MKDAIDRRPKVVSFPANSVLQVIARIHDEDRTNRLRESRSGGTNLGDSQKLCGFPADREGVRILSLTSRAQMVVKKMINVHAQKEKSRQSGFGKVTTIAQSGTFEPAALSIAAGIVPKLV